MSGSYYARRRVLASVESAYTDLVTSVFSTPIAFKAWFASAAALFAIVQVLTGARIFGKLTGIVPVPPPRVNRIHRRSGRIAVLLTLPVAFHCIFILGFQTDDARFRGEAFFPPRPLPSALGGPARRRDALHGARAALEHLEPLVFHAGSVRLLSATPRLVTGVIRSATTTATAEAAALIQNAVVNADSAGTEVPGLVLAARMAAPPVPAITAPPTVFIPVPAPVSVGRTDSTMMFAIAAKVMGSPPPRTSMPITICHGSSCHSARSASPRPPSATPIARGHSAPQRAPRTPPGGRVRTPVSAPGSS